MAGPNGVGSGNTDKDLWTRRQEEIRTSTGDANTDAQDNSILENINQGVQHHVAGVINTVRGLDATGNAAADVLDSGQAYAAAGGQWVRDQAGDLTGNALQWAGNQLIGAGNSVGGDDIAQQTVSTATGPAGPQPYDPAFAAAGDEWNSAGQNWSTAQSQFVRGDANHAAGDAYFNQAGAQMVGGIVETGTQVANTVSNAWNDFWGGVTEKAGG